MAKGRKTKADVNQKEVSLLKLVELNPDIMEEGNKTPHILIDPFVGIYIDDLNYELVKVKQITVTEDNIKSTTNIYESKYKIGDTYQEWTSMGKYCGSVEDAVITYSELKFRNEVAKLKYCNDMSKLAQIRKDIYSTINTFMGEHTIPEVVKEISNATENLKELKTEIQQLQTLKKSVVDECNDLINVVKEKRATMIAKGIIEQKERKHRNKEEE